MGNPERFSGEELAALVSQSVPRVINEFDGFSAVSYLTVVPSGVPSDMPVG